MGAAGSSETSEQTCYPTRYNKLKNFRCWNCAHLGKSQSLGCLNNQFIRQLFYCYIIGRVQLKCDGTRWRREGKWVGNWRMEWVASTLHTISEHGVSSITTADTHNSAASSRLNWRPRRFKWTRPFCRKRKSGFCACAITFQTQYNVLSSTLFLVVS